MSHSVCTQTVSDEMSLCQLKILLGYEVCHKFAAVLSHSDDVFGCLEVVGPTGQSRPIDGDNVVVANFQKVYKQSAFI